MLNINLSTILLQMANFFILVFILYRFLFTPLKKAMQKAGRNGDQGYG